MEFVITIYDIDTKSGRVVSIHDPEIISEIEDSLNESEIMFVNELE